MKIRWYEWLVLGIAALAALVFFATYFSTVRAPGVWISPERGGAYDEKNVVDAEESAQTLVDLNTASLEELTGLPGLSATRAQAIIDYRDAHGPFESAEDLLNVPGITEGVWNKLVDQVTVS